MDKEAVIAMLERIAALSGTTPLQSNLLVLEAVASQLAAAEPIAEAEGYSGAELEAASVRADRAVSQIVAKRLDWLSASESSGLWSLDHRHRTFVQHVMHTHQMSHRRAADEVRLSRRLREDLPATRTALRTGRVGVDKASALARHATTSDVRRAALQELMVVTDEPSGTGEQGGEATGSTPTEGTAVASGSKEPGGSVPAEASTSAPSASDAPSDASASESVTAPRVITIEEHLVELAQLAPVHKVVEAARTFAYWADPDADDRGFTEAKAREFFNVDKTMDGYHVAGFLAEDAGQLLKAALKAVMGVPPAGDTRSAGQRRAQAVADLSRILLNAGFVGTGQIIRPHIAVHVSYELLKRLLTGRTNSCCGPATGTATTGRATTATGANSASVPTHSPNCSIEADSPQDPAGSTDLAVPAPDTGIHVDPDGSWSFRGAQSAGLAYPNVAADDWQHVLAQSVPTWADGTGPVPATVLRQLACSGEFQRIIFGPASEVLDVGRKYRTFTAAQRRALMARDKHCTYPDCTAPPEVTEAHHALRDWADGGQTEPNNGALLCFHHHRWVTERHITMTRAGTGKNSVWLFHHTTGEEITPHYRT